MSKDRKKLLHIHSSVNDKQPTPATLELGELGVNNAKGNAFISTKNSDGEVVRFSEDETLIGWIENKEVFPYEAYVRGADNSQVSGVTEQDLLDNKSNIIIKLNQVVPENTDYSPYDEKVNGAKDIYGNLINPISAGGYKDGAGIAIDMSPYVMQGANPSFSSITTNCHATFNGTTEIKGKGAGCGSQFTVEVANACIDASDTLNEYGVDNSNFGTSCDGTKVSNNTTLKGKKISIDSPSGDLTVDIQACNHVSARTNDFVVRECQNNEGKVEIDTTDIDVSASTIDVKSCDRISTTTDSYVLRECIDGNGKVEVDTTNVNVSASTTDIKSCNGVSAETDNFILTECSSGSGKVEINTTITNINSCNLIDIKTDKLNISECSDGEGEIEVKSCNGISAITDNFVIDSCSSGGTTTIKSCDGITLESKNITLTDGDCGPGEMTIEVNDLCLVGNDKINVYGDNTNVGIDCDDSQIATKTRVYGKIVETSGNSIIEYAVDAFVNASNNICDNADKNATFYGAEKTNIGVDCAGENVSEVTTLKGEDIHITAVSGDTANSPSINLDACKSITNRTNYYGIVECGDKEGQVSIGTNETFITTNLFKIEEYNNEEGDVIINTSHITENASTTDIKSCYRLSAVTDNYILNECTDGEGKVEIDTTVVNVSADTTDIKSCNLIDIKTNELNIDSCGSGGTTTIKSCDGISAITDNFVIDSCNSGGTTTIKSCDGITLESKNIILTDGDCGPGEITIEVNDLCLVGENKINVYGKETNIGLDCNCESGATIAEKTRVFGQGVLITNDENCSAATSANSVNISAKDNIISSAVNNIVENATNISNFASSNICDEAESAATFYGAVRTNIGVTCDNTASASTTNVRGNKVIVHAASENLGLTAKQDILESSERDIIITANDNICETAGDEATFYGVNLTRIGLTCNCDLSTEQLEIGGNNICIDADDRASVYAPNKLDIGINCAEDDIALLTRVSGDTVNIGGSAVNTNAELLINEEAPTITESASTSIIEIAPNIIETSTNDINSTAENDIYVIAGENLCEKGKHAYFYGVSSTTIGMDCEGNVSPNITYYRTQEPVCNFLEGVPGFSSTTVDGALHEVYDRSKLIVDSVQNVVGIDEPVPESGTSIIRSGSTIFILYQDSKCPTEQNALKVDNTIVSMSAYTYGASEELSKKYTFWQYIGEDRVEIGEINIPKDHILKDITIVNGVYDENTSAFTACSEVTPQSSCSYYIKMVWNVFDPKTGHADDRVVYLPADEFVKDLEVYNPSNNGVCLEIWFDGAKKKISAHTESHIVHNGTDTQFTINGCSHSINSYLLTVNSGNTTVKFDPFSANTTVELPTCVNQLNRHKITFNSGDVRSFSSQTYDPGKDCANSAETINIPTSLEHLIEFNGNCYELSHDICMTSNTIVANSFYNSSDLRLKENINSIDDNTVNKVNSVDFKSFNFKDDETKTKTYGVIAQDVVKAGLNEIVHHNENGTLSVDYISLLILKMQSLENEVKQLKEELNNKKKN